MNAARVLLFLAVCALATALPRLHRKAAQRGGQPGASAKQQNAPIKMALKRQAEGNGEVSQFTPIKMTVTDQELNQYGPIKMAAPVEGGPVEGGPVRRQIVPGGGRSHPDQREPIKMKGKNA